jgi:hypothetical protein
MDSIQTEILRPKTTMYGKQKPLKTLVIRLSNSFSVVFRLQALLALDEHSKSKSCLSKSELDGLRPYEYIEPTSKSVSEDSKTCTICYDDFKSKEKVIALGCFHKFHDKCILEWLKASGFQCVLYLIVYFLYLLFF